MQISIETITPDMAAQMLRNNPMNRNQRRAMIEAYASDMKSGRWQLNGDAIRFNGDGSLIDGQHRLAACVKSNVPFQTIVIRGLPGNVRATIDGGAKRSHGDRLAMAGMANANKVSAIARLAISIAYEMPRRTSTTDQELDYFIQRFPAIANSVSACYRAYPQIQATIGTLHLIGYVTGASDRADAMLEVWKSGVPDYDGDPMHLVRDRISRTRGTPSAMTSDTILRLMIAAWASFVQMRPVKVVKPSARIAIDGWTKDVIGL